MYPRLSTLSIRLTPQQAETLLWEVLGILDHYKTTGLVLDAQDETALRTAAAQLEAGIKRSEAVAAHQLEQLRALTPIQP